MMNTTSYDDLHKPLAMLHLPDSDCYLFNIRDRRVGLAEFEAYVAGTDKHQANEQLCEVCRKKVKPHIVSAKKNGIV